MSITESEIRFARLSQNAFLQLLEEESQYALSVSSEAFKEQRNKNMVMRIWENGNIERYQKFRISVHEILSPFLTRLYINKEVSFDNFPEPESKKVSNIERFILRFKTYEWHLKKKYLKMAQCFIQQK